MLIDKQFELEIPTHIAFTLYKNDYVDNLIISKVKNTLPYDLFLKMKVK